MKFILFFMISFFVGAFPTAYIVVKRLKGVDVRTQGSGNVGATNVFRVLGKGPGSFVFFVDFIKGALPAFFLTTLLNPQPDRVTETILLLGLGAIFGHVLTPLLNFRGGKGVATGAGVVFAALPLLFAGAVLVWVISFKFLRTVSLSSILAIFVLLVECLLTRQRTGVIFIFAFLATFILWTHRSNISRLIRGSENKL